MLMSGGGRRRRQQPAASSSEELDVSWVACDGACARWFHAACVHITPSGDDEWLCEQCGDEQPDDCPMRIATCCQVTCRLTQRSIFACCAYFVRLRVCFLGGSVSGTQPPLQCIHSFDTSHTVSHGRALILITDYKYTNSGAVQELYRRSGELAHTNFPAHSAALDASAQRGSTRMRPHTRHARRVKGGPPEAAHGGHDSGRALKLLVHLDGENG